ncbi:MAG: dihydrolipoyl dehydrogenase [Candidatus Theseobacter exili]|nr:dihydrolipoyl dehydrogenase [Candidatus Theseobacter exili]
MENIYDLIVIGCGPGGMAAAIKASSLGLKTAVIEKDKPGGVCLHSGCIPSKAIIHKAELFRSQKELEEMGLKIDCNGFDYNKVFSYSKKTIGSLLKGTEFLLKKSGVFLIKSEAKITDMNEVILSNGAKLTAKSIIIATGSKFKEIPGCKIDEKEIISSLGALNLQKLPKRLMIIGSGPIGIEFAHIMNVFGVEVQIVEMMKSILPFEDTEIVDVLRRDFRRRGIAVYVGTKLVSAQKSDEGIKVVLEKEDGKLLEETVDKLLIAVGRTPNTQNVGLGNVNVQTDQGFISVNDNYQTAVKSIYAVGDVINTPMLAHVASKEGELAAENAAGLTSGKVEKSEIPRAVYCEPQIACFGYTETEVEEKGISYLKGICNFRSSSKAVAIGKPDGLIKVLCHKSTKEILGVHIIGAEATELIHEMLLAKKSGIQIEAVGKMVHAHPSLSECIMEVAKAFA